MKVIGDVENKNKKCVFMFDKTIFFPCAGGQASDDGTIVINGKTYTIYNCLKFGPCVIHYSKEECDLAEGDYEVEMHLNKARRL